MLDPLPSIWILTLGYCLRNPSAQIVERIRTDAVDITGHPADFDVAFQAWVERDRVIGIGRWDTGSKSPQEGEAPETGLGS